MYVNANCLTSVLCLQHRYNKQYDYNKLEEYIIEMKNEMETEMTRCLHENYF